MDSKDQRNGVPTGTFTQGDENAVPHKGERTAPDPSAIDTSPDLLGGRPSRRRVRTLLGIPLADAPSQPASGKNDPADDISQAIESVLTESVDADNSIPIEIEEIDDDVSMVTESDLSEYVESVAPGTLRPVELGRPSDEAKGTQPLPLLIPSPYAAVQTREPAGVLPGEPVENIESPPSPASVDSTGKRDAERDSESLVATQKRPTLTAAKVAAGDAAATPAPAGTLSSLPPPTQISSLAPREVRKPAPAAPSESTPRLGLLMVAAMVLIAFGGWWLTAGSFGHQDETAQTGASAPAAAAQPLAAPAQPAAAPAPAAAEPAPTQVAATAPAVAADALSSKSGVAGRDKGMSPTGSGRALRAKRIASKTSPETSGDLPETPSRAVVVQRLEAVRSSVQACASGRSGVADLDITVLNNGVVTHVLVGGDFAGTMQGSCIARAVRTARFPSFKQERLRVLFPYAI